RLVGPGIDLEEQVSLLDLGPLFERHHDQVSGYLGDDVIGMDGFRLAGKFRVVGDLPLDGLADRNRRRLRDGDSGSVRLAPDYGNNQSAGNIESERSSPKGRPTPTEP